MAFALACAFLPPALIVGPVKGRSAKVTGRRGYQRDWPATPQ